MRTYGNKVGNENNNFLKQHYNFSLFMVTFSYSTCCHLGVEPHKSRSQRMENSEARLRKSERLGPQPTLQMGIWGCGLISFCSRNMPVWTGLITAPFLSFSCYTRTVSCSGLAGLSFTSLCIREPDWRSGICLRHTVSWWKGPTLVTQ